MTKYTIAFSKGFVVARLEKADGQVSVAITLAAKLMALGYRLSPDAIVELATWQRDDLVIFYKEVQEYIHSLKGDGSHTPFYSGFPEEVLEASDIDLFLRAMLHYVTLGECMPAVKASKLSVAFESPKYQEIRLGTEEDFLNIYSTLVESPIPVSEFDFQIVRWFLEKGVNPPVAKVGTKEMLSVLAAHRVVVPVKDATDVLRIARFLSGGDVALLPVPKAEGKRLPFKFKSFSMEERKYLLSLLEGCSSFESMGTAGKRNQWIALGEKIHPNRFAARYPRAAKAFSLLRENKLETWEAQVNLAFIRSDKEGIMTLGKRPSNFFRKLDWLLRTKAGEDVFPEMEKVAKGVSSKVLFETLAHFEKRNKERPRSVFLKKRSRPVKLSTLPPLSGEIIFKVQKTIERELVKRTAKLSPLGTCWVDPELKNIPLPKGMGSLNSGIRTLARGTKLPFPESVNVLRAYVYWEDSAGRIDIDLSATFMSRTNSRLKHVLSYSTAGLKIGKSCHSGDIRFRRGNNAEYIDIDIEDALRLGYTDIIVDVRNFQGGTLEEISPIFGVQEREFPESNSLWQPDTVALGYRLTSKDTACYAVCFSLEERKYIFLDVVSNKRTAVGDSPIDFLTEIESGFSVYDLLSLHVQGRGIPVLDREAADTVFTFDSFLEYTETVKYMNL